MILAKVLTIVTAVLAALGGASPATTENQARKDFISSVDFCSVVVNRQDLHTSIDPEKYVETQGIFNDAITLSRLVSPECGKDRYDGCLQEYNSFLDQLDKNKKSPVTQKLRKCVNEDFHLQYYPQPIDLN